MDTKYDERPPAETHPSYGLVSFHRISGGYGTRFFGSALANHHGFIELKVQRAKVRHDLGQDWYYGGEELMEVWITSAQFAQLITTMNVAEGTPCTLHSINQEMMPEPPPTMQTEQEKIHKSFAEKIKGVVDSLEGAVAKVDVILGRKTLRKMDREDIQYLFKSVAREITANAPFLIKCFEEAAEKVVTAAKVEVESFVVGAAIKTGIHQLRKTGLVLGPAEDVDEEYPAHWEICEQCELPIDRQEAPEAVGGYCVCGEDFGHGPWVGNPNEYGKKL